MESDDEDTSEDEVESNGVAVGKFRGKVLNPPLQKRTRNAKTSTSEDEVESNDEDTPQKRLTLRVSRKGPSPPDPPPPSSSPSSSSSSSSDDDDDNNKNDDHEEEEKMGGQSDILISVRLLPLFQLHCQLEDKPHYLPNTKACKFNVRGLDISRLTCMDPQDNMPSKLRAEEQNANISVVDGVVVVVVTSFSEATEPGVISLPMTSVAFPEGDATHYATPLELDTINEANRWLRGIAFEKSEEHGNQATTVEEGLKEYISLLENQVPKQISAQNLHNFIADHHWPTNCWGIEQCE